MNPYLLSQIEAMDDPQLPAISRLSNLLAVLFHDSPQINWAGIYLYDARKQCAYLGPFQGLPACTTIPVDKGVIGAAIRSQQTLRVENVEEFPGHIACDSKSRSEIVIPLWYQGSLLGVLDMDSTQLAFFNAEDQKSLESAASRLSSLVLCITL